jgi:hypothetical protein
MSAINEVVRHASLEQQDASCCYLAPDSQDRGNGEGAIWKFRERPRLNYVCFR